MPKLKNSGGSNASTTTIEYVWVEIPYITENINKMEPFMVNAKIADYIENLEGIIKGYEKIIALKNNE